ncbi:MAG: hypothetical protein ACYSSI_14715 [Planctomycetota bacterium]
METERKILMEKIQAHDQKVAEHNQKVPTYRQEVARKQRARKAAGRTVGDVSKKRQDINSAELP